MASAMIFPIASSLAEIVATCAVSSLVLRARLCSFSDTTTLSDAFSNPRLSSIGLAPAATFLNPSSIIACARMVAVVVPSPAISFVLEATSFTSWAPIFSNSSLYSCSWAMVTPSLVISGDPNFLSIITLRPRGPSVILTALVSLSIPAFIFPRASSSNMTSFDID